jgi:hypothetical protein
MCSAPPPHLQGWLAHTSGEVDKQGCIQYLIIIAVIGLATARFTIPLI